MLGSKDYELHILQEQRFVFRRNANSRADVDPRATTLAIAEYVLPLPPPQPRPSCQ